MRRTLCIIGCLWGLFCPSVSFGQAEPVADKYLEAAVAALGEGDHELGLQLLEHAAARSRDPRIVYYTAYALEKSGRCVHARAKYEEALAAGPERFSASAREALAGLSERCPVPQVVAEAEQEPELVQRGRRSRGTGWRIVGWVTASLGAIALGAAPVKNAIDHKASEQAEQPFEAAFECTIDFGKIGDDCDEAVVRENPNWQLYEDKIKLAKRTTIYLIAGGAGLLAVGVTSFVVGATRPIVAVVPLRGGAYATMTFRF